MANQSEIHYTEKLEKLQKMIETKKKRTGNIDCVLVMDLTYSMQPYIEKMKIELSKLIKQLSEDNKEISLRFGFIGYKDFCDCSQFQYWLCKKLHYASLTKHFTKLDFTTDMKKLNDFLNKQKASGGGDVPEDLVGGLNQALKLSWRADAHKIVILVADAPTHGSQYHELYDDEFPKGHPNKKLTLEAMMDKFAKIAATFLVFRLENSTQKMFEIMKKQYKKSQQKLRFVDLREVLKNEQCNYKCNSDISDNEECNYDVDNHEEELLKNEQGNYKCNSDISDNEECNYNVDDHEEHKKISDKKIKSKSKVFKEDKEPKKIVRASSIINLKITEKIMVLSEASDCEDELNEEWDKK